MINIELINLSDTSWPEKLYQACISVEFGKINKTIIEELKDRLSSEIHQIIVEFPYRDFDFSSTYSLFYTKKHRRICRESLRFHFFGEKIQQSNYFGFMTLRPSFVENRGRSHIHPKAISPLPNIHIVAGNATSHLLGKVLTVDSFPWMAQETDIAVCAHVAVWSIINYFANKYSRYKAFSIAEIATAVPGFLGRTIPSEGLNLIQISSLFTKAGFFPLLLKKDEKNPRSFFQAVYAYIESGIPLVGVMTRKEHAVALIGHGPLKKTQKSKQQDILNWSVDYIDEFIISDDNDLPFTFIPREQRPEIKYCFEDLDYIVVPLYEKMYLNANVVMERIRSLADTGGINIPSDTVCRPYLTSTRSLKKHAYENQNMNDDLKNILLRLPTPQFIWCADFVIPKDDFTLTVSRIIIDATAGTFEPEPWLIFHDQEHIVFFDSDQDQWYQHDLKIEPYTTYRNNLRRF